MGADTSDIRLSRIKTRWTTVAKAYRGGGATAVAAQRRLLLSYYRAVYHYLRGMLRDAQAAEELTQEFSVRFLRGNFQHAQPERGRFRDLVKTAVRNLALDYWKRQQTRKKKERGAVDAASVPHDFATPRTEAIFLREWREALLEQAWQALARLEKQTGSFYFTALHYKSTQPRVTAVSLARHMSRTLNRAVTAAGVRQLLHRARWRFADCLVAVVARSLHRATPADVEQELAELRLLAYCQEALQRYRKRRCRA